MYIYGSPIFRLEISLDEKNIVFYFCFIFFSVILAIPALLSEKKQQQQQIILRGSQACRLGGNLVPRGKTRRWLNLLHWWNRGWNGKKQQKHRWIPHRYYTSYLNSKAAALKALGWLKLSHWWNSRRQQNYSFLVRSCLFSNDLGWIEPAFYVDRIDIEDGSKRPNSLLNGPRLRSCPLPLSL